MKEQAWPDSPVAVLMDQRGDIVRVMPIRDVVPVVLLPARRHYTVSIDETPQNAQPSDRVFRLSDKWRSREHRWWRVYNEGRSKTPEGGYVYVEVVSR